MTEFLIELDADEAGAFSESLREADLRFEGPQVVEALDGVSIATFIVTVTPVLAPAIVKIIQAIKGTRGRLRTSEKTLELENLSLEDLHEFLGTDGDSAQP